MYHEFFSGKPLLSLPIAAMLIFMITFAVILVRALRGGAADPAVTALPLSDDEGSRRSEP